LVLWQGILRIVTGHDAPKILLWIIDDTSLMVSAESVEGAIRKEEDVIVIFVA